MSVTQVLILAVIAIAINQFKQGRSLALLGVSALVMYWIQPVQDPVNLTFWFPTFTLALTVISWLIIWFVTLNTLMNQYRINPFLTGNRERALQLMDAYNIPFAPRKTLAEGAGGFYQKTLVGQRSGLSRFGAWR
jgi:hypothetical protein